MPEKIAVTLFPQQPDSSQPMRQPEMFEVPIQADYLYGAPAANNAFSAEILSSINTHPFSQFGDFHFGDPINEANSVKNITKQAKQPLDEQGFALMQVPNPLAQLHSPLSHRVNASVYETGGRAVQRSVILEQLNQPYYLGIRPKFKE